MAISGDIWIQGGGELASGVAWRLTRCGYRVIVAEIAEPLAVRRLVCFGEAVREGRVIVEGIEGTLATPAEVAFEAGRVVVVIDPGGEALGRLCPAAIIDARMTKREPTTLVGGAALRIGLGPGFECGRDVDCIIETHRAARLGEVIRRGSAAADTGRPGAVAGETVRRLLRSPAAGRLESHCEIGDLVTAGQEIGRVAGEPLVAGIAGRLRGLIHPEVELNTGWKVGDIDPRGADIDPGRVSDKSLAIAGGVLEALLAAGIPPRHRTTGGADSIGSIDT